MSEALAFLVGLGVGRGNGIGILQCYGDRGTYCFLIIEVPASCFNQKRYLDSECRMQLVESTSESTR